ncbi:hypothetical protein LA080_000352 [Diaporthe eres]|nr:hypothetical protein LA080_000352 [Diaporthe eres]
MFSSFARDSFWTCRVMRTPESMQTLTATSKSRLGSFVKTLSMSTGVLRSTNGSSRDSRPSGPPSKTRLTVDQEAFISTGSDREILTEALLKLKSVQFIQIRNVYSPASYSMSTAPRDSSARQRSLGLRKILLKQEEMIEAAARREPPTVPGDIHSESACFYSTLLALGKANARPKELRVAGDYGFDCKSLHIPACIALSVIPVLAQLENLHLTVSPGTSVGPVRGPSHPDAKSKKISTYDLRVFLQHMTRLRDLSLRLYKLENRYDGFIEWPAAVPTSEGATQGTLPQSPPAITFNCLQKLSLYDIYGINVQVLLSVARKFAPTLQKLHLHKVHLEISQQDASTPRHPGSVRTEFLKSLEVELSDELRDLYLGDLMETEHTGLTHHPPRVPRDVTFHKGQKHYRSCQYSGSAMKEALEAMIHYIEGDSSWTPSSQEGKWRFTRSKKAKK